MIRSKVSALSIALCYMISSITVSAQEQHQAPIGDDSPEQVEALADALCGGAGYTYYGYDSYEQCYVEVIDTYPHEGEGSGKWIKIGGGTAYRWGFCGRLGCY